MKKLLIILLLTLYLQPCLKADEGWELKAQLPSASAYFGETLSNGIIGMVSSPEPMKLKELILAGSYDKYGRGRVSNYLSGFNMFDLQMSIDGVRISDKNIKDYVQTLDMRNGMMRGEFLLEGIAKVEYSYLALRQLPFSGMLDVSIYPLRDIELSVSNTLETPSGFRDPRYTYNEIRRKHARIRLMSSSADSPSGNMKISASSTLIFPVEDNPTQDVTHATPNSNNHSLRFSKKINAGNSYSFSVVGSTISTAFHPDPENESERLTVFAALEGRKRLLDNHCKEWAKLWESDIEIEGDQAAQLEVRGMLYHLYSFTREGSPYSISPMGLSGLGYNGHIFWDADIWVYPALLLLKPEMAKSFVEYRCDRLEAARKNAFEHGYKGAMYPWESTDSGFEETPVWALAGTFEHHISGCVALAAFNYYRVTQDKEWLMDKGYPVIKETADFWCDRAELNDAGEYEILNVVGADEWAENVDNDAFTNGVAKTNLEIASKVASILGKKPNPLWKEVSSRLLIHRFENGVTREHKTYNGEGIKQADVNLLAYPLKQIVGKDQIKRDLAFYEERVPEKGTPAMTQAIFGLLYARLGDPAKAYHFFQDAYKPNSLPPFGVIAETKGGTNPYFITGAGGVLQTVMMGFCGLEIEDGGVVQRKGCLPSHWKSLVIKGVGPDKKQYHITR